MGFEQSTLAWNRGPLKIPNHERAVVDRAKLSDYLLNAAHPDNGGKARFFEALGFSADDPATLIAALRLIALNDDVALKVESVHGIKYVIDGKIESPTGKQAVVRTIWIVDRGDNVPRLVTAYPRQE